MATMTEGPDPSTLDRNSVNLEQIISGTRCSPLTLKEFEGFLIHEERSVENLQFTVWYRSYCERFNALAPEYKALAEPPQERYTQFSTPAGSIRTEGSIREKDSWWSKLVRRRSSYSVRSLDLERADPEAPENGQDAEGSPKEGETGSFPPSGKSFERTNTQSDNFSMTSDVRAKKGLRFAGLAPLMSIGSRKELPADTPLPFLEEIQLIKTTFFLPGATKELNIDARLRRHILKSLQPVDEVTGEKLPPVTTHPDVFKEAAEHVYNLMERSLPHYLQWAKGNTNTPKMLFWTGVGITDMAIGVMFAVIIIYFAHSRWWRIFSFLFYQFGAMQAYSASRYFCSQVHGRTSRQLYPWELSDTISEKPSDEIDFSNPSAGGLTFTAAKGPKSGDEKAAKGVADLQASLPFLFEPDVNPFADGKSSDKDASSTGSPAVGESTINRGKRHAAVFRSKFFASMKRKDGKKVPMFGPERVVEDPYIKYIHDKQMKEILIVGAVATFIFLCIVVAIPERTPLR